MRFRFIYRDVFTALFGILLFSLGSHPICLSQEEPDASIVSTLTILIQDTSPDASMLQKLAQRLILPKIGGPFLLDDLQQSIDALKKSGLFRKIHVPDPVETDGKINLVFELTPFSLIKKICIDGEFPMLEQDILREMDRRVGDPFDPKTTTEMEKNIIRYLLKEGYIDPKVSLVSQKDEKDGRIALTVSIQKGPFCRIRRVTLEENRSGFDFEFLTRLKTWQASRLFWDMARFAEKDLEKDVKNLFKIFRQRGYLDVEIEPIVKKDPESRLIDISLRIREGPFYDIVFSGNQAFLDSTLKKDLPIFERGNKGNLALKRGIRAIRNRYRKAGYPKVKITTADDTLEEKNKSIRTVRIHIDEGPQSLVRSLRLEGNRHIEEDRITEKLLTKPSGFSSTGAFFPKTWGEDKAAVKTLYHRNGFIQATIDDTLSFEKDTKTGNQWVDAVLRIREGVKTLVGNVAFKGLSALTEEDALSVLALKPGAPYRDDGVSMDKNALIERISEKGYPHVDISEAVTFCDTKDKADITYTIDEGPFVKVGDLFIRGNFRTNRKVVLDRVDIREGNRFSLKRLLDSNRQVSRIQAFENSRLQLVGFEEKSDRVDVVWNVEERKPYLFEIGGGYDTARELYVLGRLEDRNLFGRNKSIWMKGEYSLISYLGEAGVTDPDFFRSGITATGSLFTEKQEKKNQMFGVRRSGSALSFQKRLADPFEGGLAFLYESRKQYRLDDEPILPEDEEQYEQRTLFVVTPSLQYATVDSYVRPKKGLITRASVDASKGLDNTLDDFIRYRLEARYYRTPAERLTVALRARCGIIQSYSADDNVADDQLFYLGGLGDIRGFEENRLRADTAGNAVGGRLELLGNIEVRYDLGSNFEISVFYDLGTIRDTEIDEGYDDLRSSVGVGLSYITPVGPISLMYGHKLDRKEGESSGRIHFSIGYTF